MAPRLYDVTASPNCKKVRVVARELGVPLELVPLDFAFARTPEYLSKNPAGKVPTLVEEDGFILWESGAILIYLAGKGGDTALLPAGPREHAEVMRWMFFFSNHVQPWLTVLGQERLIKPRRGEAGDPGSIALAERELARFLPILDGALATQEYLVGQFSIADIAAGCGLDDCERRGVTLEPYPHLAAWRARLRARPSWQDH